MEKRRVRSLFDSIAYRYDLLNHLLSGGVDLYWRRKAIEHLLPLRPKRILDVATGTADFAIAALRLNPQEIVGVDIADEMLRHGREKLRRRKLDSLIRLESGDVEDLQFDDRTFDAAIVAFGARNFTDLERGLSEMHRVLHPGGRIVVLEFSRPKHPVFRRVYVLYFTRILPAIGRIVSRDREAYAYLPATVMQFPDGEDFLVILRRAGFRKTREERLTLGIASIYSGAKEDIA